MVREVKHRRLIDEPDSSDSDDFEFPAIPAAAKYFQRGGQETGEKDEDEEQVLSSFVTVSHPEPIARAKREEDCRVPLKPPRQPYNDTFQQRLGLTVRASTERKNLSGKLTCMYCILFTICLMIFIGLVWVDPLHHPEIFRPSSTSYTVLLIFAGLSLCLFGVLVEIGCLLSARRKGESGLEQRINLRMRTFKNMDEYIDIDV